ncbi:MAG TPA: gliding motility-associated C-terminal domain-containing protein, partial [Saprospiraceae bacterium]|nr:gliding motility-associated C-terminal domain-containing protein [Saprospiraceae bacterium]
INVENNASFIWSDGNPDRMRMFTEAGTYTYQITNQYGCIASDTFTIAKLPPATSLTTDILICDGETFTYMDKAYDVPGNYTDTIKGIYGCDSIIFRLNLGIYPFIPIVLAGDLSFCEGNSTTISIESPHNQLMLDDVNINSPLTLTESGDFLITGTDQNGCITEKEISITIHPNPEVLTLDMIDTVFVQGLALPVGYNGDIDTYRWSPSTALDCADCPFPTLLTPSEGIYTISIEDKNGCKNESQLSVSFQDTKLYIPNIISNHASDPENQVFYVKGNNSELYSLSVYDRWGNLIFHRKDAEVNNSNDGWSPRGKVASGVYVCLISYMENGESKTLYGSITVLD